MREHSVINHLKRWQLAELAACADDPAGPVAYAEGVVDWLDRLEPTQLYWRHYFDDFELFADPIRTEPCRSALASALIDESGALRQAVANTLACCDHRDGKLAAWQALVMQKAEQAGAENNPDLCAQWLLAGSFAMSLDQPDGVPRPLAGEVLIRQAIRTAETEPVRMQAVHRLVMAYLWNWRFGDAEALLAEHQDAETPEGQLTIAKLRDLETHMRRVYLAERGDY